MRRSGFSLRRQTATSQKYPSHMVHRIVAYVMHVRGIQKQFNFHDADIIAMDKTPVWNDMVANTTVEKTGSKEVPVKSTGHDKVRVSICLTKKANGTRLKPFIVFKGDKRESKDLHDKFHRQCSVASSADGWMNEELKLQWCNKILGQFSFRKRLLAWYSYKTHVTDNVKKAFTKSNIKTVIVPDAQNTFERQMFCGISLLRGGLKSFTKIGLQTESTNIQTLGIWNQCQGSW